MIILAVVALVLGIIELFRTKGQSLVAWGIVALGFALSGSTLFDTVTR
jgi:uncharacterized membrane protein